MNSEHVVTFSSDLGKKCNELLDLEVVAPTSRHLSCAGLDSASRCEALPSPLTLFLPDCNTSELGGAIGNVTVVCTGLPSLRFSPLKATPRGPAQLQAYLLLISGNLVPLRL